MSFGDEIIDEREERKVSLEEVKQSQGYYINIQEFGADYHNEANERNCRSKLENQNENTLSIDSPKKLPKEFEDALSSSSGSFLFEQDELNDGIVQFTSPMPNKRLILTDYEAKKRPKQQKQGLKG